ncbi:hypothetical protein ACFL1H_02020 [Nanoarchaeota archaeon]
MAILKFSGCPPLPERKFCMGPNEQWWLFEIPLKSYPFMILISLLISAFLFLILFLIDKYSKFKITLKINFIISISIFILILIMQIIYLHLIWINTVY